MKKKEYNNRKNTVEQKRRDLNRKQYEKHDRAYLRPWKSLLLVLFFWYCYCCCCCCFCKIALSPSSLVDVLGELLPPGLRPFLSSNWSLLPEIDTFLYHSIIIIQRCCHNHHLDQNHSLKYILYVRKFKAQVIRDCISIQAKGATRSNSYIGDVRKI